MESDNEAAQRQESAIFDMGMVVSVFGRGTSFYLPKNTVKSGKTGKTGLKRNLMNRCLTVQ